MTSNTTLQMFFRRCFLVNLIFLKILFLNVLFVNERNFLNKSVKAMRYLLVMLLFIISLMENNFSGIIFRGN